MERPKLLARMGSSLIHVAISIMASSIEAVLCLSRDMLGLAICHPWRSSVIFVCWTRYSQQGVHHKGLTHRGPT